MGISCGGALIKYLLFFFNLLWLILGGVVLWLGFKIANWSGDLESVVDNNMKVGSITILVTGFVIFLIAFLGCCGAIKENSCMLSTYGGIILLLIVVQCVGAYYAFKNKVDFEDTISKGIKEQFLKFKTDAEVRKGVQEVQKAFECCGALSPEDVKIGDKYPASCCGEDIGNGTALCAKELKDLTYKDGCVSIVQNKLEKFLGGLGGVAIALILIQLLIVMAACCLSRESR